MNYFESPNMNYNYNVVYFDAIKKSLEDAGKNQKNKGDKKSKDPVEEVNKELLNISFPQESVFSELKKCEGFSFFELKTEYPGLLIGTGNLHNISQKGAYKLGFSFDHVNGLPYLPGSSLKGILRNVFPGQHKENREGYEQYLMGIMAELGINNIPVEQLANVEQEIFDNQDVFLGAYPSPKNKDRKYLASEYITPHKPLKNPNPISFVKVKPDVIFQFSFLLKNGKLLSADRKLELFKHIILDFGAGAKTNVGFGKFQEV